MHHETVGHPGAARSRVRSRGRGLPDSAQEVRPLSTLWKSFDALRGDICSSGRKHYILTLPVVKHVSGKPKADIGLIDVRVSDRFNEAALAEEELR